MTLEEFVARELARDAEPEERAKFPEPFWPNVKMFESYFWGKHVRTAKVAIVAHEKWHSDTERRV